MDIMYLLFCWPQQLSEKNTTSKFSLSYICATCSRYLRTQDLYRTSVSLTLMPEETFSFIQIYVADGKVVTI